MDHSRRTALKSLAIASATVAARAQENSVDQDIVHLDDGHQVIDNFAASDCWSMQKVGGWSMENRQRVANLLFSDRDGIALSCWRFNIGGGINPQITDSWRTAETFEVSRGKYDWSRQRNERWFLEAAKSLGVPQFLAFVNSPPGRLTRNGLTFCDPESGTTNLKPGAEDEYGRYLGDILEHFAHAEDPAERISFDYISPVNEPQWDWSKHAQEGNRASNRDIKAIVQAVALGLEKRRLPTQIASLESGSLPDMRQVNEKSSQRWGAKYGNYIDSFLGDPGVNGLMSGRIGYHAYGSDRLDGALVANREQLGKKMAQYPRWKLWQTEYCVMEGSEGEGGGGRDLTMKTALEVARVIHLDLSVAGASAWQWWTALSPVDYKDGLIYTDWKKAGDAETIYPAKILWALGNYSRFVRPGMQRVSLQGIRHNVRGLMGSAYKNAIDSKVVAVYINVGDQARRVNLKFQSAAGERKPESLTSYLTSDEAGENLKRMAERPDGAVEIPGRSVVTLVAELKR